MKTYTFATNNKPTKKNFTFKFFPKNTIQTKSPDYSKILDNIIADNIIKSNDYIAKTIAPNSGNIIINNPIIIKKRNDAFEEAAKFLANYGAMKNRPFIFGKIYRLIDGTPIVFYEDEIQIDYDIYSYSDFANFNFINGLKPEKKKIIIDIFTNGININFKINK